MREILQLLKRTHRHRARFGHGRFRNGDVDHAGRQARHHACMGIVR
jgi:hypothetical protein